MLNKSNIRGTIVRDLVKKYTCIYYIDKIKLSKRNKKLVYFCTFVPMRMCNAHCNV